VLTAGPPEVAAVVVSVAGDVVVEEGDSVILAVVTAVEAEGSVILAVVTAVEAEGSVILAVVTVVEAGDSVLFVVVIYTVVLYPLVTSGIVDICVHGEIVEELDVSLLSEKPKNSVKYCL